MIAYNNLRGLQVSLKHWKEEIADMPTQAKDGNWYDLETGLYFDRTVQFKKEAAIKDERLKEKLVDLRTKLERLVKSQSYSIEKFSADERYETAVKNGRIFLEQAEAQLKSRITKEQIIVMLDRNSEISRMFNNLTKGI